MKLFSLIAAGSLIVFGAFTLAADAPATDLERLQGKWVLVWGEFNGKPMPPSAIKSMGSTVEVKGNTWAEWDKGEEKDTLRFFLKLDPRRNPKEIDLTDAETEAGEKPDYMLGIYSLEGDVLKFCVARPSMARPKEFKSDKNAMVRVYKRVKG